MTSPHAPDLLTIYQHLAHVTQNMRCAAEQQDWDLFLELDMKHQQATATLPSSIVANANTAIKPLIVQILADQQAIQHMAQLRISELESLIHNTGRQRKLEHAYGSVAYY